MQTTTGHHTSVTHQLNPGLRDDARSCPIPVTRKDRYDWQNNICMYRILGTNSKRIFLRTFPNTAGMIIKNKKTRKLLETYKVYMITPQHHLKQPHNSHHCRINYINIRMHCSSVPEKQLSAHNIPTATHWNPTKPYKQHKVAISETKGQGQRANPTQ